MQIAAPPAPGDEAALELLLLRRPIHVGGGGGRPQRRQLGAVLPQRAPPAPEGGVCRHRAADQPPARSLALVELPHSEVAAEQAEEASARLRRSVGQMSMRAVEHSREKKPRL
eukprot:6925196-Pyramimonas_sp.AAC.1